MAVSLWALFVIVFEGGKDKVWNLGSLSLVQCLSYVLVSEKS